jgi:hypothetical protein
VAPTLSPAQIKQYLASGNKKRVAQAQQCIADMLNAALASGNAAIY